MNNLTLGSLFDGSGGFPLAGKLAGIQPIWSAEIEPFPIRVTTKRMPEIKHYGNVAELDGGELEPVDIITFGSPCQDLSVAGKRNGLDGAKSSLFYEAIRIIKEMRCATGGSKPRFIVWENVSGAFSSNGGEDFRSVLESVCSIKEERVAIPKPEKWNGAGTILAESFSVAWRTLDAQFWGVPQRRKRVFLVADFDSHCAPPILFESDGLSKYSQKVFRAWQKSTKGFGTGTDQSSELKVFENHTQDARYTGPLKVLPTCSASYGTGGNNQPFVVHNTGVDIKLPRQHKYHSGCYVTETETCRTIDTHVNGLSSEQGGTAVVSVPLSFGSSKADRFTKWDQEQIGSLAATDYKDGPMVYESEKSFVRRLTPTECARLQGFPDWWCSDLETENPTESDLAFWRKVFTDYAKVYGKKARTDNQIKKFLANPHTDSAEYKTWGNGVALPCVWFVLAGIKFYAESVHESVLNKYLESV